MRRPIGLIDAWLAAPSGAVSVNRSRLRETAHDRGEVERVAPTGTLPARWVGVHQFERERMIRRLPEFVAKRYAFRPSAKVPRGSVSTECSIPGGMAAAPSPEEGVTHRWSGP
jgi:hypothetical protein